MPGRTAVGVLAIGKLVASTSVTGRPHARFRILARCRCRNRRKVPLKRMSFLVEAASAAYGETCPCRRPTGGDRALKSLKPSMGLLGHHLLGKQRILLDCLLSPAPAKDFNELHSRPFVEKRSGKHQVSTRRVFDLESTA
jgi:hypothetical protein